MDAFRCLWRDLESGDESPHSRLREFDEGGEGAGFGEEFAELAERFEVNGEGVADSLLDFAAGPAGSDAARQVRRVGSVAGAGFFDDDEIFFHDAGKASRSK